MKTAEGAAPLLPSTTLGLTQLAYFSRRVCDAAKVFERSHEADSVTHQLLIVTLA